MSGCARAVAVAVALGIGFGGAARADSRQDQMTKAKVEADLGHSAAAITIFAAIAADPTASRPLQAEALVRLGAARKAAGDDKGSVEAFERMMKEHSDDEAATRLLILAAGGALPGKVRWEQAWTHIQLGIDVTDPNHPTPEILWPEAPSAWRKPQGNPEGKVVQFTNGGAPPYTGLPVKLDFKDGDLQDVFRLFADISGLNVVVNPGVQGEVTFKGTGVPWDDCLDRMLSANGLWYQLNDNVLHIAKVDQLLSQPPQKFTGKPIDLELVDRDLKDAFREIASHGKARVDFGPTVAGRVTLKLQDVHWDQAFDLLARVNALRWTRQGNTLTVGRPDEVGVK